MLSIKTVWWLQHIVRQFQSTHPFSWQDIVVWRSYIIVVHHRVQSHIQNSLLGLLVFNRVRWWHEIDKGPIYSFWGKADSQHRGSKIVCAAHVKPLFAEHSRLRCWSKTHVLFVPDQVQERIETCTCLFCFLPFLFSTILSDCDIMLLLHGGKKTHGSPVHTDHVAASAGADAKWHQDNGFYLRDSADADASMRDVGTQSNRMAQ